MEHQDWNRVVFNGPSRGQKKGKTQQINDARRRGNEVQTIRKKAGNAQHQGPANLRGIDSDEIIDTPQLTQQFRLALQKARVAAQLSQADLAQRINEKQSVVNQYESGRAIPNNGIIVKLERALNTRLPRPPKPARNEEDQ